MYLSLSIYIYIDTRVCVCVCIFVCVYIFVLHYTHCIYHPSGCACRWTARSAGLLPLDGRAGIVVGDGVGKTDAAEQTDNQTSLFGMTAVKTD